MDLYNAIEKRISIRKYDNITFDSNTLSKIREKLSNINPLMKDIKARLELIEDSETANSIGTGFLYGLAKITAPYCIVAVSEVKKGYLENIGFMQEQLVLELTDMGIGTCWLGTFDDKKIRQLLHLREDEKIINVITAGYPFKQQNFRNNGLRNLIGSHRKKDVEVAYYNKWGENTGRYLEENQVLKKALNMSILAPSGGNKQPVHVLFSKDCISFFVKNKKNNSIINPWAELDAGIFISHFYLCCLHEKLNISFYRESDASGKFNVPEEFSYVISLRVIN